MTSDNLLVDKPSVDLLLAAPRGFCAGVVRAIDIVQVALKKWGAPVYVRHEIVHNKFVVEHLKSEGAIFVDELNDVPDNAPVIFSAHGVPKSVTHEAQSRKMIYVDATCPLVSKVHNELIRHYSHQYHTLLIGHEGHPEVIGTLGQVPKGYVTVIDSVEVAQAFQAKDGVRLAYVTQTTLSVDDTSDIVETLQQRFPNIISPKKQDICYATTNRQQAVKAIAGIVDSFFIIGSKNSSNSCRLAEVAEKAGCAKVFLIDSADNINWRTLGSIKSVGISAGASAPESLVDETIEAFAERFHVHIAHHTIVEENVVFNLPKILVSDSRQQKGAAR